ncbi:MAG: Gfo/Idh/MocA family oxidoreductase [Candidatus Hydrogenedentes bacterium]|nr:Gfo/Idh/MocA family oxidoreductase [Candidatus Hydrogenedentota bacterium]
MKKRIQKGQSTGGGERAALSRRGFLKQTAAAAAGAVAFPAIIPASALGLGGNTAPSERLVMGCIGVGSQGTGNMKGFLGFREFQIVAVCDVDRNHRLEAARIINETYGNQDCQDYGDFREILERDDLDVVSIAVPDHWHAIPAIAAAKKGLDIYAEKPLALTISQGRAMVDAVHRYGVIWQTGSWQRSKENFRRGCELVRNGRIGKVHTVKVGLPTGSPIETQAEMPVPEGFDYDFWLGPAPSEPYTEKRCHWNFRWILDYSGGQLTDWAAHHCDIANWGMGTEHTGPIRVKGQGFFPRAGLWNAATNYFFECEYSKEASPVAPDGFTMLVSNSFPMGTRFEGTDGWIFVDRGDVLEASAPEILKSEIGPKEMAFYKSSNHARNFLECVRSREQTIAPIDAAHHAIAIAHLGNIAMQLEREVHWDPAAERFVNDPEADRKLSRAMRGPWHL